ncbi:MAG: hypothetical protein PHF00_06900 [Elusimicrobia bacterium]|nr:hypothetical protein [Elusimicrobiota bacterium]
MRYFVLLDGALQGPLTAEQARGMPGFSAQTPVCREDRDAKLGGNWTAAAYCRGLFGPNRTRRGVDGGAARYWRCATAQALAADALAAAERRAAGGKRSRTPAFRVPLAGAVLALAAAGASRLPTAGPPIPSFERPRGAPAGPELSLARRLIPVCGPAAEELRERLVLVRSATGLEAVLPADGRRLKADVRFELDVERQELRPIGDEARRLLDERWGCGRT